MKKNTFIVLFLITLLPLLSQSQIPNKTSYTIGVGTTLYFGDLGGANYIGRPLFFDLERSLIRPVVTLGYHHQISRRFGYQIQGSYTAIAGDDKLIQPHDVFAPEWFRWYRNLNFQSKLWEISFQAEFYLTKYEPGSLMFRVGPYVLAGVGMYHFNPKGLTNDGSLIELRPLHTEGQGFTGSDNKEYSLYQPCVPIGAGIRYNLTSDFTIGFEYADRKTFTDYIDDVSTNYVAQADFTNYFSDGATANLAYDMSVQSEQLDPSGVYATVTAPTQQRGDPSDLDHYIFAQFNFCYTISQRKVSQKSQMKCMKWGGEGGQNTKRKR